MKRKSLTLFVHPTLFSVLSPLFNWRLSTLSVVSALLSRAFLITKWRFLLKWVFTNRWFYNESWHGSQSFPKGTFLVILGDVIEWCFTIGIGKLWFHCWLGFIFNVATIIDFLPTIWLPNYTQLKLGLRFSQQFLEISLRTLFIIRVKCLSSTIFQSTIYNECTSGNKLFNTSLNSSSFYTSYAIYCSFSFDSIFVSHIFSSCIVFFQV